MQMKTKFEFDTELYVDFNALVKSLINTWGHIEIKKDFQDGKIYVDVKPEFILSLRKLGDYAKTVGVTAEDTTEAQTWGMIYRVIEKAM